MCLSSLPDGSVVQLGSDMFKMGHPLKVPLLSKNNCTLEGREEEFGAELQQSYPCLQREGMSDFLRAPSPPACPGAHRVIMC